MLGRSSLALAQLRTENEKLRQELKAEKERAKAEVARMEQEHTSELGKCKAREEEKAHKLIVEEQKRVGEEKALQDERYKRQIAVLEAKVRLLSQLQSKVRLLSQQVEAHKKELEVRKKSQRDWIDAVNALNDRGDDKPLRKVMQRLGIRENTSPNGGRGYWNQQERILEQRNEIESLQHEFSQTKRHRDALEKELQSLISSVNSESKKLKKITKEHDGAVRRLEAEVEANAQEKKTMVQQHDEQVRRLKAEMAANAQKMNKMVQERDQKLRCLQADVDFAAQELEIAHKKEQTTGPEQEKQPSLQSTARGPPISVGQAKTPAKVVIGIDMGDSYSGVSILYKDTPETVCCGAPGARGSETKVPTILYRDATGEWAFGHEAVEMFMTALEDDEDTGDATETAPQRLQISLFRNFCQKIGQENGTSLERLESATAESVNGNVHGLMDLIKQTLLKLADFAMEQLRRGWGDLLHLDKDGNDIQWVVSVPASWNDHCKIFLRKAACEAGLVGDVESGRLHLVSEPDAAALAVHSEASDLDLFDQGTSYMVLDCGGKGVNITIHQIQSHEPLDIKRRTPIKSGSWGGQTVDTVFLAFLATFLSTEKTAAFANGAPFVMERIMKQFRKIKESFDPQVKDAWYVVSIAELLCSDDNNKNDDDNDRNLMNRAKDFNQGKDVGFSLGNKVVEKNLKNGKLTFSSDQMWEYFFRRSMEQIVAMVSEENECDKVKKMLVVGGFGSSKALASSLTRAFPDKTVIVPDRPQAVIAKGAALFGLYTPQRPYPMEVVVDPTSSDALSRLRLDLEKLQAEKEEWESVRQQEHQNAAHLEKVVAECQEENQQLVKDNQFIREQLENAKNGSRKHNPVDEMARATLEGSIVKRQDAPSRTAPSLSFPTGPEISKLAAGLRDAASDFLHGLHDELMEWTGYKGPKDSVGAYRVVMDEILLRSWREVTRFVAEFERSKLAVLSSFLGGDSVSHEEMRTRIRKEKSVLPYFWKYSMQEAAKHLSRNKGKILNGYANNDGTSNELMEWVSSTETSAALEELDSPTWVSFTEDLILLSLFCRYSDPPCYLWPNMGTEAAYSPEKHKLEKLSGNRKKPKTEEKVHVLFPGLYFVDPMTDSTIEAKSKPVVISFPKT